ncbi:DUF5329 domain-containing protein [Litoribacillus peritrichatus]|uniref:YfeK family protein n=1 Tax=Litoribacillus peritrichatus TaxID=718191 RepID=A0ABP7MRP4_9GAMM
MNFLKLIPWASLFLAFSVQSAPISATTEQEIAHLLLFVTSTPCQYERNGTLHNGVEAVAHIQKKYDYFKDDIESAEDFIEYSATESKMSGRKYQVHCDGAATQLSSEWLLTELRRYRQTSE